MRTPLRSYLVGCAALAGLSLGGALDLQGGSPDPLLDWSAWERYGGTVGTIR